MTPIQQQMEFDVTTALTEQQEQRKLPNPSKPHVLIVDSFALLFRGFFALAVSGNYMQNSKGLYTNGIYQFTRYMMDAINKFSPTHVVCTFDMGKSTFRNDIFEAYKATRNEPPTELVPQFDKLWELVEAFDIPCIGKVGYEADDVMGTLAKRYAAAGANVSLLTGDGDSLQLIDERTNVIMLRKGFGNYEVVSLQSLYESKGVRHPYQIIEMKGLMGDTSDNIPGCPGVGPKTAGKLIEQFDTVDGVFASIDEVKGKLKDKLLEHKELIYLSRDLATIRTDVDVNCELEQCEFRYNREKLLAKFEEFEFKNLMRTIA